MIAVGLVVLLVAFVVWRVWVADRWDGLDTFLAALDLVIVGPLFFFVVPAGVAAFVGDMSVQSSSVLQALGNNSETSGSFFLGSGTVGEEQVFNYVILHEGGFSTLESRPADQSRIVEEVDAVPRLVVYDKVMDEWWLSPLAVSGMSWVHEFHVPVGSVVQGFEVKP